MVLKADGQVGVYSRREGAVELRARICMQDFFDTRLLAMDTDFRMFSSQHHGSFPGIDIAYIMDGAAYHTKQDTLERIRKGTVQVTFNPAHL